MKIVETNCMKRLLYGAILIMVTHLQVHSQPVDLQCEYLYNPLGVDVSMPRLSWKTVNVAGMQRAWQVMVSNDSASLLLNEGNTWNSGVQTSDKTLINYAGKLLQPFTRYYWTVITWYETGKPLVSKIAHFETGMRDNRNWQGSWISDNQDTRLQPAAYFRKAFTITKKIVSARAYVAVAGLYELSINGKPVGNHRLDPAYTRFDRRTLYLTHDITQLLQTGSNAIGILLGNGWYNHQSTAVWFFDLAPWRARPKCCIDVRITYADGTTEILSTGKDWKTALSPVIFNSIYTAEHYDARREQFGWNQPEFADTAWKWASIVPAPSQNTVSQQMHPIRDVKEMRPVKMTMLNPQDYMFDFGQNFAGVSEIQVKAPAGTTLRIIHAERLTEEGKADLSNIDYHYRPTNDQDPFATDILITSGRNDVFRPRFNYKGFQYVEVVSDVPIGLTKESLKAYFLHSDVPVMGSIQSSSETLNKISQATNQSYLSNLFGYPTDCPQREKNGWTGDAHIAIETGLYNFDGITVYEKWLADHRDEQQANGVLPAIIPTGQWGYNWANGPDWTSTIAIIPWNIYLFYGDAQLLEKCYDNIKRYVDHITAISPTGLTDWGLGDWIPIRSKASKELTSSIYYYADASILAKAARLLGNEADVEQYTALSEKIKKAINQKYLNRLTGLYGKGLQTELSAPLYWGIVPADMKNIVARNLAERVQQDSGMDVGLLGSKTILNALSENGYATLAYQLASRETYPSWGWWIKNGATTLYENWKIEGAKDISLNHIMFGEISAWYYKALGGILPDTVQPGFKHILLKPHFVTGLQYFTAKHIGPYGEIVSAWKRIGKRIFYDVTIPSNSAATVHLSGRSAALVMDTSERNRYHTTKKAIPLSADLAAGTYKIIVDE
jgi:alpha-L-rhamnosidase